MFSHIYLELLELPSVTALTVGASGNPEMLKAYIRCQRARRSPKLLPFAQSLNLGCSNPLSRTLMLLIYLLKCRVNS
jgi:hypothetical protein